MRDDNDVKGRKEYCIIKRIDIGIDPLILKWYWQWHYQYWCVLMAMTKPIYEIIINEIDMANDSSDQAEMTNVMAISINKWRNIISSIIIIVYYYKWHINVIN